MPRTKDKSATRAKAEVDQSLLLAVDAAVDGDIVLVANGTYPGNLDFGGKAIIVQSENGLTACIIDAGGSGPERHRDLHDNKLAREHYQSSLDQLEWLVTADPDRADFRRTLSVSYKSYWKFCWAVGLLDESQRCHARIVELAEMTLKRDSLNEQAMRDRWMAYLNTAAVHTRRAEEDHTLSMEQRMTSWQEAIIWLERSMGAIETMRTVNLLGDRENAAIDDIEDEIERCRQEVTKLKADEPD